MKTITAIDAKNKFGQLIEAAQRQRLGSAALDPPATVSNASIWRPPATDGMRSLVALQPCGSAPPLFCVHGLGGHVTSFLPLALGLGLILLSVVLLLNVLIAAVRRWREYQESGVTPSLPLGVSV